MDREEECGIAVIQLLTYESGCGYIVYPNTKDVIPCHHQLTFPTSVLLDSRKTVISFGYEAQKDKKAGEHHTERFYFADLSQIFPKESISIYSSNGKSIHRTDILTKSLQHLVKLVKHAIPSRTTRDFKWIIVTETCWSPLIQGILPVIREIPPTRFQVYHAIDAALSAIEVQHDRQIVCYANENALTLTLIQKGVGRVSSQVSLDKVNDRVLLASIEHVLYDVLDSTIWQDLKSNQMVFKDVMDSAKVAKSKGQYFLKLRVADIELPTGDYRRHPEVGKITIPFSTVETYLEDIKNTIIWGLNVVLRNSSVENVPIIPCLKYRTGRGGILFHILRKVTGNFIKLRRSVDDIHIIGAVRLSLKGKQISKRDTFANDQGQNPFPSPMLYRSDNPKKSVRDDKLLLTDIEDDLKYPMLCRKVSDVAWKKGGQDLDVRKDPYFQSPANSAEKNFLKKKNDVAKVNEEEEKDIAVKEKKKLTKEEEERENINEALNVLDTMGDKETDDTEEKLYCRQDVLQKDKVDVKRKERMLSTDSDSQRSVSSEFLKLKLSEMEKQHPFKKKRNIETYIEIFRGIPTVRGFDGLFCQRFSIEDRVEKMEGLEYGMHEKVETDLFMVGVLKGKEMRSTKCEVRFRLKLQEKDGKKIFAKTLSGGKWQVIQMKVEKDVFSFDAVIGDPFFLTSQPSEKPCEIGRTRVLHVDDHDPRVKIVFNKGCTSRINDLKIKVIPIDNAKEIQISSDSLILGMTKGLHVDSALPFLNPVKVSLPFEYLYQSKGGPDVEFVTIHDKDGELSYSKGKYFMQEDNLVVTTFVESFCTVRVAVCQKRKLPPEPDYGIAIGVYFPCKIITLYMKHSENEMRILCELVQSRYAKERLEELLISTDFRKIDKLTSFSPDFLVKARSIIKIDFPALVKLDAVIRKDNLYLEFLSPEVRETYRELYLTKMNVADVRVALKYTVHNEEIPFKQKGYVLHTVYFFPWVIRTTSTSSLPVPPFKERSIFFKSQAESWFNSRNILLIAQQLSTASQGKHLGICLGVPDMELARATTNSGDIVETNRLILMSWKQTCGNMSDDEMYETLCEALGQIGRRDIETRVETCYAERETFSFS